MFLGIEQFADHMGFHNVAGLLAASLGNGLRDLWVIIDAAVITEYPVNIEADGLIQQLAHYIGDNGVVDKFRQCHVKLRIQPGEQFLVPHRGLQLLVQQVEVRY